MVGKGRAVGAARPVRVAGDKIEHGIGACHRAADSNVRLRAHVFSSDRNWFADRKVFNLGVTWSGSI